MESLVSSTYKGTFDDVAENFWGTGYIEAAYDMGLINGADGKFRPNDTISREEMCKILYVSLKNAGKLREMGEAQACEQVMLAVSDFEKGNLRLSTILAAMNI